MLVRLRWLAVAAVVVGASVAWITVFGRQLTFAAECNGSGVDAGMRALYGPGDPGFGLDSDFMGDLRQVSVANGLCSITAVRKTTPSGRMYGSAAMATYGTFAQRYGTFEARIRYPKGAGVWPAFWLLSEGTVATPPEVDVLEARPGPGLTPVNGSAGTDVAIATNHYAGGSPQYTVWDAGTDLTTGFHVWRLEWTPLALVVKVDGTQIATLTGHVPTTAMYPIINLAIGATGYRADGTTPSSLTLDVDYIRVYAP